MAAGVALAPEVQTTATIAPYVTDVYETSLSTSPVRTRDTAVQTSNKEKAGSLESSSIAENQTSNARILDFKTRREIDFSEETTTTRISSRNATAERIMRAHFANDVLSDLENIRTHCGDSAVSSYVNRLFRTILHFRDRSPLDPFLEILMALYDSMVFDNRWSSYDARQYAEAYRLVRAYATQNLDNKKISKGIIKLQRLGFDTIPFGFDDPYTDGEEEHAQDANINSNL
jgi:hypothetical protein